jgi:hypothetical protein
MVDSERVAGPFGLEAEAERRADAMNAEVGGLPFLHPVAGEHELCVYGALPDGGGRWWVCIIPPDGSV